MKHFSTLLDNFYSLLLLGFRLFVFFPTIHLCRLWSYKPMKDYMESGDKFLCVWFAGRQKRISNFSLWPRIDLLNILMSFFLLLFSFNIFMVHIDDRNLFLSSHWYQCQRRFNNKNMLTCPRLDRFIRCINNIKLQFMLHSTVLFMIS